VFGWLLSHAGRGQASEASEASMNAWEAPWASDGDELVQDSDRSESPVLVEPHKAKTSQCGSGRGVEGEVEEAGGLASPTLTSTGPSSAHLELRRRLSHDGDASATRESIRKMRRKLNR
jgi:hypothetical protein